MGDINAKKQRAIDGAEKAGSATGKWVGKKLASFTKVSAAVLEMSLCGFVTFVAAACGGVKEGIKGRSDEQ